MKTIKKFNAPNYPTKHELQEMGMLTLIGAVGVVVVLFSLAG